MSRNQADLRLLNTPEKIAEAAENIYAEKYKDALEKSNPGEFAVIDVTTSDIVVAKFPEDAMEQAREGRPNGIFHLIRIGAPGAFRVSYTTQHHGIWDRAPR